MLFTCVHINTTFHNNIFTFSPFNTHALFIDSLRNQSQPNKENNFVTLTSDFWTIGILKKILKQQQQMSYKYDNDNEIKTTTKIIRT